MKIKFKSLSKLAIMPKKGTQGAAAYDLYVPNDVVVCSGRQIIPLDFSIEIPYGYEAKIEPRSGCSSKGMEGEYLDRESIRRFDCDVIQGKIDSDYRGCIGVIVNNKDSQFVIPQATRIAQLTFYKVENIEFVEVEELSETNRGDGGFGSTGK